MLRLSHWGWVAMQPEIALRNHPGSVQPPFQRAGRALDHGVLVGSLQIAQRPVERAAAPAGQRPSAAADTALRTIPERCNRVGSFAAPRSTVSVQPLRLYLRARATELGREGEGAPAPPLPLRRS